MSLVEQIEELDRDIQRLEAEKERLLQKWADETCPYKVGEVVECRGYAHTGKQVKITKVGWTHAYFGDFEYEWMVQAKLLKKDGTEAKISTDWRKHEEGQ